MVREIICPNCAYKQQIFTTLIEDKLITCLKCSYRYSYLNNQYSKNKQDIKIILDSAIYTEYGISKEGTAKGKQGASQFPIHVLNNKYINTTPPPNIDKKFHAKALRPQENIGITSNMALRSGGNFKPITNMAPNFRLQINKLEGNYNPMSNGVSNAGGQEVRLNKPLESPNLSSPNLARVDSNNANFNSPYVYPKNSNPIKTPINNTVINKGFNSIPQTPSFIIPQAPAKIATPLGVEERLAHLIKKEAPNFLQDLQAKSDQAEGGLNSSLMTFADINLNNSLKTSANQSPSIAKIINEGSPILSTANLQKGDASSQEQNFQNLNKPLQELKNRPAVVNNSAQDNYSFTKIGEEINLSTRPNEQGPNNPQNTENNIMETGKSSNRLKDEIKVVKSNYGAPFVDNSRPFAKIDFSKFEVKEETSLDISKRQRIKRSRASASPQDVKESSQEQSKIAISSSNLTSLDKNKAAPQFDHNHKHKSAPFLSRYRTTPYDRINTDSLAERSSQRSKRRGKVKEDNKEKKTYLPLDAEERSTRKAQRLQERALKGEQNPTEENAKSTIDIKTDRIKRKEDRIRQKEQRKEAKFSQQITPPLSYEMLKNEPLDFLKIKNDESFAFVSSPINSKLITKVEAPSQKDKKTSKIAKNSKDSLEGLDNFIEMNAKLLKSYELQKAQEQKTMGNYKSPLVKELENLLEIGPENYLLKNQADNQGQGQNNEEGEGGIQTQDSFNDKLKSQKLLTENFGKSAWQEVKSTLANYGFSKLAKISVILLTLLVIIYMFTKKDPAELSYNGRRNLFSNNAITNIPIIDYPPLAKAITPTNKEKLPLILGQPASLGFNATVEERKFKEAQGSNTNNSNNSIKQAVSIDNEQLMQNLNTPQGLGNLANQNVQDASLKSNKFFGYLNSKYLALRQKSFNFFNEITITKSLGQWKSNLGGITFEIAVSLKNTSKNNVYVIKQLEVIFVDINGNAVEKRILNPGQIIQKNQNIMLTLKILDAPRSTITAYVFVKESQPVKNN
ncbi:hypothetical protein ABSA28_00240 [Candidatus Hepatincolaceae symbiont of Richtersius coronifer]